MNKPTRIKYSLKDNKYESNQSFLGNEGVLLKAIISPGNGKVGVYAYRDEALVLIEEDQYDKFTQAKATAKALLKKYGVVFFEETRNKKGSSNV